MIKLPTPRLGLFVLASTVCLGLSVLRAADHADSPTAANDASGDLNDVFFFLDPNDNTRVILAMTTRGFLVPSEAVNMGIFDPKIIYRFNLEGTGDATADATISVTFGPRTSSSVAQTATVRMVQGSNTVFQFNAPATNPTLNPTPPTRVVTTDANSGVSFFAGEVDDPFTFDIPAFSRFVASVLAGAPDGSHFNRGRDSFAGYNTMSIALSLPRALLPQANNVVGVYGTTLRADVSALVGNLSTRGKVEAGENVLITGVIVTGTASKRVIVRGIGPASPRKG